METTQLVLRREAQRARYRHAWWIALAAGASGNALLVLAMWASAPRAAPANVSVMPAPVAASPAPIIVASPVAAPVIVVVPQPAAAPTGAQAFGDLGPCPEPHTARPTGALRQPSDATVEHVAAAPTDSRLVAAWNEDDVFVSRDGGSSWDRVLAGPGAVLDASFDCHGRVLVLREGNGLGMRDGVREAWRTVPGVELRVSDEDYQPRDMARVIGGGRSLAVTGPRSGDGDGEAWAAISDDGGVSWHHADLGWYDGTTHAAWEGDALRIMVPWTDCMSEGIRLVTVTGSGVKDDELGEWSANVALDRTGPYVLSEYCEGDALLCIWRPGRDWRALVPAAVVAHGDDGITLQVVDGPVDVIIRNDTVQTLTGARLGKARTWPFDADPLATDLAGRLWGKDTDGRLIRR
ncbi:MAG TPA: hypothetical protein VM261_03300 [Kofleriaceae bacterium]|nr:hypothetical protein [Kofleriaceae bacterium]